MRRRAAGDKRRSPRGPSSAITSEGMASMVCRRRDDAKGLIPEAKENAVIRIGADHDLIGRRERLESGFLELVLQCEQMFRRTEELGRCLRAGRSHSGEDQYATLVIARAFSGQH